MTGFIKQNGTYLTVGHIYNKSGSYAEAKEGSIKVGSDFKKFHALTGGPFVQNVRVLRQIIPQNNQMAIVQVISTAGIPGATYTTNFNGLVIVDGLSWEAKMPNMQAAQYHLSNVNITYNTPTHTAWFTAAGSIPDRTFSVTFTPK